MLRLPDFETALDVVAFLLMTTFALAVFLAFTGSPWWLAVWGTLALVTWRAWRAMTLND